MAKLGLDIRSEYLQNGVTVARRVLGPSEVQALRVQIEQFIASPRFLWKDQTRSADTGGKFLIGAFLWRWNDVVRRIALDSPIPDLASHVLGGKPVRMFYDQLFYKRAGTRTPTQWHQDLPFWPFAGDQIPSLWIALTQVDRNSSAVIYRRGSHLFGPIIQPIDAFETRSTIIADAQAKHWSSAAEHGEENLLSFDLEPGDVVIHHPLVMHGAGANKSDRDRIGLSMRYLGPDVTWQAHQNAMFIPGASGLLRDGDLPTLEECFPLAQRG